MGVVRLSILSIDFFNIDRDISLIFDDFRLILVDLGQTSCETLEELLMTSDVRLYISFTFMFTKTVRFHFHLHFTFPFPFAFAFTFIYI